MAATAALVARTAGPAAANNVCCSGTLNLTTHSVAVAQNWCAPGTATYVDQDDVPYYPTCNGTQGLTYNPSGLLEFRHSTMWTGSDWDTFRVDVGCTYFWHEDDVLTPWDDNFNEAPVNRENANESRWIRVEGLRHAIITAVSCIPRHRFVPRPTGPAGGGPVDQGPPPQTSGSTGTIPAPPLPDLNGDGIGDLLSQTAAGDLYAYPGSGSINATVTGGTFESGADIGSWAGHVNYALGDLDGDGRPDLLSQTGNGDLYVYPGSGALSGPTTFWSGTMIGNWAGHTNFVLGDLNGDGKADLLSQVGNGDVYVYPGSGSINSSTTFWSGTKIGNWAGHVNLALGDLNADGRADLLSQTSNGNLYAYPGSGHVNTTTTFWSGTMIGNWAGHTNYDLADVNGDHVPDLVTRMASGAYYAYPGSGHINASTTFWSGTQIDIGNAVNFALGDLNGDHLADLLTQSPDGHLNTFPGTGHITATTTQNTTFWSGTNVGNWAGHTNLTRGDLNGDGIADLLTQTANGDVYVYRGSGAINATTTFWSGVKIGNWAGHTNLALGDLNGDHIADLLTQTANGDVYVYRGSGAINATTTFWSGVNVGNWAGHNHLVLGDLNGDGVADLLTQTTDGNLWVYRASGSINTSTTFWSGTMVGSWSGHVDLALGDVTGDRIADLISQTANGDLYAYPGSGSINSSNTFWSGTNIGNWAGHTNITL